MIIFLLFYIPLTMPFELNIIGDELKAGISIILMLDMILEMNALCFINGFEVRSREKIIKALGNFGEEIFPLREE